MKNEKHIGQAQSLHIRKDWCGDKRLNDVLTTAKKGTTNVTSFQNGAQSGETSLSTQFNWHPSDKALFQGQGS